MVLRADKEHLRDLRQVSGEESQLKKPHGWLGVMGMLPPIAAPMQLHTRLALVLDWSGVQQHLHSCLYNDLLLGWVCEMIANGFQIGYYAV